jgi:predicted nuclease of restriction endonuclease-like (RecB) superfamily
LLLNRSLFFLGAMKVFLYAEALKAGWSVRQLDRQVSTQFYERVMHSKQPAALLARGQTAKPEDLVMAEEDIRDPYYWRCAMTTVTALLTQSAGHLGGGA